MNTTKINRTKLGRTLTAAVAMAAITSGCAIEGGDTGEDDAASGGRLLAEEHQQPLL